MTIFSRFQYICYMDLFSSVVMMLYYTGFIRILMQTPKSMQKSWIRKKEEESDKAYGDVFSYNMKHILMESIGFSSKNTMYLCF